MTIESTRQDIVPIQMLRGVAAAMVVFVHLGLQLKRLGYGAYSFGWLSSGVDIFFVISGFIMWVSVERRGGDMTAAEFMRRRIIRIVPLYWLLTTVVLATCILAPHLLRTTVLDGSHATASYLFLPARHPVLTEKFWPLLIPGWTLNYEMLFYALFAVAIAGSSGSARTRLVLIVLLITGTILTAFLLEGRVDAMHFYANPVLFEFLAGIAVGILYLKGRLRKSWAWLVALGVGFFLLRYGRDVGLAIGGTNLIAATMIVAGGLFLPAFSLSWPKMLGDASYSLYLTHVIVLSGVAHFWQTAGLHELGPLAFMAIGVTFSIVGALCCYRLVELPMTQSLREFSRHLGVSRTAPRG